MASEEGATPGGLEELSRDDCLARLRTQPVGRLAVAAGDAAPHVVPVNYILDGENVVFRSGPGTKLSLLAGRLVSFQVDSIDVQRREGWSVLISGRAYQAFPHEVGHLQLEPYAKGDRERWVRIEPERITGRRIRPHDFSLDPRGYL
jgi:nitroimidazol reductase NimA-like FMN-containing flavoprotein (pyridoxamine 5'-phosphate oxidase superfamily)